MKTLEIVRETACIMYKENAQVKKAFFINQNEFSYLTELQIKQLEKRLLKNNVMPIKLYKGNYSDSLYLQCKNKNYSHLPELFTFRIGQLGHEKGLGYNYKIDKNFTLLIDFLED